MGTEETDLHCSNRRRTLLLTGGPFLRSDGAAELAGDLLSCGDARIRKSLGRSVAVKYQGIRSFPYP